MNKVSNQGTVSGSNFSSVPTDDPDTALPSDATVTAVSDLPVYAVEPYKSWALTTDADGNGYPSPGDTLTYTVTLENTGNQIATNVTFTDVPDPNSPLVAGSVTTTGGSVTEGNTALDNSVLVTIASIPISTTITVTFKVIVTNPLPFGVTQLSNQGFVSGTNFPVDPTDDPTDQSYDNPTVTPLTAAPLIEAYKRYELTDDVNKDGKPGVGDNLTYIITITNKGNQNATGVSFNDTVDANTSLIAGTVITSQGTVTAAPTGLSVNIGVIPGRDYTVNISFKVTITGGSSISNQGTVTATGLPDVLTDDPNTHTANDATYTAMAGAHLSVTKSAILAVDADNNNVPSPGDTLQYIVAINNNGGSAATVVNFTDNPDTNTSLVVGTVSTTQGNVVLGNGSGNTTVDVNIGILEAGPTHSICLVTFQATIKNPFPVNTDHITNQGTVKASGLPDVPTDDPNTDASPDATVTTVYADPLVTATKRDSIYTDVSPTGASPGDVLLYTVVITNTGTTAARSVVFQDAITDPYLTLLDDSVTVPPGASVIKGNVSADKAVQVDIGYLPVGSPVTITFKASITTPFPLPTYINKVTNQGLVSGSNFASVPTDDPDTILASDPTSTAISPTDIVEPYKTWALTIDADHNGIPSPGDTLTYTVTLQNAGNHDVSGVVFNDVPDLNSTLLEGSVTTTRGSVTEGNNTGDNSVAVNVGTLPFPNGAATITFRVIVNNPLPAGVTQLSNQGFVSGPDFPSDPTDDPTDQSYDNPTVTPLTAAPLIEAYKRYELTDDVNKDGKPGVGDNLTYIITIINKGNQNATGVSFNDTVDPNTSLIVGTTIISQGTVTSETTNGLAANIGTIPGGNYTVNISFKVTINLSGEIYNHGHVNGTNFGATVTDDPNTHTVNDPTYTALAAPNLVVTKSAILAIDADNNNVAGPGDTLQYIVAINNNGGSAATVVIFTDTPDANTSLVVGSVSTTQGDVVHGNSSGESTVEVNIPTLEAGSSHSICLVTFEVLIKSPLTDNITTISNRGTVIATGIDPLQSDDPNTPGATVTTAYAKPVIYATKIDTLVTDINGNGIAEPGDTLEYTINITNTGTTAATSVVFTDPITDNISLTGYLTVPAGSTIVSGNLADDPAVEVNMPVIAVAANLSIVFRATIDNPLPAGVNHVSNQGYISGANFSEISTDDPRTDLKNDSTSTPVIAIPFVEPYKTWSLTTDADYNGYPSPGDTLTYSIVIENTGSQNATGVVFSDIPDANSVLVAGSIATDRGAVTTGNGSGDNSVLVNVGTLPGAHASATITFRVRVNSTLPPGVAYLSNQGFVSGSNFPSDPTDDPNDESYDNPTVTPLTAAPFIRATKSYQLSYDANSDGLPGPGDNLTYIIDIVNNGNQNAAGVNFTDTPDANTTLFAGSVTTSQGLVSKGNTAGHTDVEVNIGTLPGGGGPDGSATVSFTVIINDPLPVAVTQLSNQGDVAGGNFTATLTDDPGTTRLNDATETYLALTPALQVTKAAILATDADNTGLPSPGDIIQYIITINNTGNGPAESINFTDTPDPNTSLVVGSVSTTAGGSIVSGNTAGNTVVSVNIPTLPGGAAHSVCLVTFKVSINSPFPAGSGSVSNQGIVSGANFDDAPTEDPGITGAPDNFTITAIYPGPTPPTPPAPTPQAEVDPTSMLPLPPHSSSIAAGTKNWPPQPTPDQTSATKGKPVDLPSFKTSNLVISETEDGHAIYVDVTNTGKAAGTYALKLRINGYTHEVKYIRLNPSASGHVEWLISSDEPGNYTVEIDSLSGTYTVDAFKLANRLINPDIVLIISMALILASLMLAVVYVWRKRQNWYG